MPQRSSAVEELWSVVSNRLSVCGRRPRCVVHVFRDRKSDGTPEESVAGGGRVAPRRVLRKILQ